MIVFSEGRIRDLVIIRNPKSNMTTQKRHRNLRQLPKWCGKTGLRDPNLPNNRNSRVIKRAHNYKFVNNPPYKGRGPTDN